MEKYAVISNNNLIEHLIDVEDENIENPQNIIEMFFPENKVINTKDFFGSPFVGGIFDGKMFMPPKPYESWTLKEYSWVAPKSYPDDGNIHVWNEDDLCWQKIDV